jgi:N-methylhydantoinase A/oxoprolinase/acetone carboxylase beta subunit
VTATTAADATNLVNLDIGGTFTDAYVVVDGEHVTGKSLTTHADLADGLLGAVSEAAGKLGRTLDEILRSTDLLQYSTTVGTNALLERTGPRVGLIATAGQEDTIHVARSRSWADGMPLEVQLDRTRARRPPDLVPGSLRVGVRERIDSEGEVILPLQEDDVLEALDAALLRNGVARLPADLGLADEEFIAAVAHAPSTRPDRFTVLEHLALDEGQIRDHVQRFGDAFAR